MTSSGLRVDAREADILALSCDIISRAGGRSVHKAASILLIFQDAGDTKCELSQMGTAPTVSTVHLPDIMHVTSRRSSL